MVVIKSLIFKWVFVFYEFIVNKMYPVDRFTYAYTQQYYHIKYPFTANIDKGAHAHRKQIYVYQQLWYNMYH